MLLYQQETQIQVRKTGVGRVGRQEMKVAVSLEAGDRGVIGGKQSPVETKGSPVGSLGVVPGHLAGIMVIVILG